MSILNNRSMLAPRRNEPEGLAAMVRSRFFELAREWKLMFGRETLYADIMAGAAVALVALPLSLAVANASGVPPKVGLVTAIVGGIVVAIFGGSRLQVSGPDAAFPFLVYEILTKYGFDGLIAATIMAGLLLIGSGVLGFGRFIQLLPRPVVAGFLSGIGLTILSTQASVLLGVEVSHDEEGGALALLWQTVQHFHEFNPATLAVGLTAAGIMLGLPRITRKLPTPLVAVVLATLLPWWLNWDQVAVLGAIPSGFPAPTMPQFPWGVWNELVLSAVAIFVMASLSSLLSASVTDSLSKGARTNHDQELIGQGLGNLASAMFGGIPVSGAIARTVTNFQAGARTRLASVVHALLLLAMMFGLSPLIARIPLAALAGVLCAVALRMIEFTLLKTLWRHSRAEAAVFIGTTGAIVMTDLIVGIPVGMIGAFAYVVYEMSRIDLRPVPFTEANEGDETNEPCSAVQVIRVDGPLFFASGYHLRVMANRISGHRCLILDLERVSFLDMTGAEALEEAVTSLASGDCRVILARPSDVVFRRLVSLEVVRFPALRSTPIYGELRDAMLHATTEVGPNDLCRDCRDSGRCAKLVRAIDRIGELDKTSVPTVRAVISRGHDTPFEVHPGENGYTRQTPNSREIAASTNGTVGSSPNSDVEAPEQIPSVPEPLRVNPVTSWNRRRVLPVIHPSAFVDPLATVIGEVSVGERVYIGPGVSVRADEGTPFFIGADTNIQDGVTLHALKGKVVLVGGRPYAIHIGRNVCLTHHALVHGPCHVGDRSFIGFKATVHDAIVGEGCVVGIGAVVVGVRLPPGRYVGPNQVVDTQEKADALPPADAAWLKFREEVVEVNQELASGHREVHGTKPAAEDDETQVETVEAKV